MTDTINKKETSSTHSNASTIIDANKLNDCIANSFITDLKYTNGKLEATSSDGTTTSIPLESVMTASCYADNCISDLTTNSNGIDLCSTHTIGIGSTSTPIEIDPRTFYVGDVTTDDAAFTYPHHTYPITATWQTYATSDSGKAPYFIEKDDNFRWIAPMFARTYVECIANNLTKNIQFFGLCKGEVSTISVALDPFKTSVKDFFSQAVSMARLASFDDLFGPLSEEVTMETYVRKIEEKGVFIKELYDQDSLIAMMKDHRIELNDKVLNGSKPVSAPLEDEEDEDEGWFSTKPWFTKEEREKGDKDKWLNQILKDPDTFRIHDNVVYSKSSDSASSAAKYINPYTITTSVSESSYAGSITNAYIDSIGNNEITAIIARQ